MAVDSLNVPAIGRQPDSKKDTMPAYSFGTGTREVARQKVYISEKHDKTKSVMISPGPVYAQPTTVGNAPKYSFGTDEQRKHPKSQYPDSSVDLTCSQIDSQTVKFKGTPGVHFGTESRMCVKNAELFRAQQNAAYGMESPGALEYFPERSEPKVAMSPPQYSFGTGLVEEKNQKEKDKVKITQRMKPVKLGTPRHVGPGSHAVPQGIGMQPISARQSAPQWSFGTSPRGGQSSEMVQLVDVNPELSSLGKQVVSRQKTMPRHSFGTSTRENASRAQVVMTEGDRGPVAAMPKPRLHIDLPSPILRLPPKAGL